MSSRVAELTTKFQAIGLTESNAKDTAGNKKISLNLENCIEKAGGVDVIDRPTGLLLYSLASLSSKNEYIPFIVDKIKHHKLTSTDQVSAAVKFCETNNDPKKLLTDFDAACGVGVVVTDQEIAEKIAELLKSKSKELETKRYTMLGVLLGMSRKILRWANSLNVKTELDKQMLEILGPKDERDGPKPKKKKETPTLTKQEKSSDSLSTENTIAERAKSNRFVFEGALSHLHKPGENPQINDELMKQHLKRTGGKVITRFPPEPNGFLHIGHAKAININFAYAEAFNGLTNLRYDDTNPEAEEEIYFKSILETIEWLGFKPSAITYSSDHFQKLFDLAVELIKKDKAYVCHCTAEEMFADRGGESKGDRKDCRHRNRPISESLTEFERMKNGEYKEGQAILRMKMDMQNPNPQFWDLVAYRVMHSSHVRTHDKWCIYPTYDYTHCLVDSFEDITHSLCTTEFVLSRESYYWLVDALEVYKPVQWEYGRLKLTNTVLSKRKLNKLVTDKYVSGWDDPRLHTLMALRRRGFTPEAINAFVREGGVTTTNSTIKMEKLENYVRSHLNEIAPRLMAILDPIRVNITNLPYGHVEEIMIADKLGKGKGHVVPFSKTLFIDASDFKSIDEPDFYRLAPGKTVGLLNVPHPITCTDFLTDSTGKIIEIRAKYETESIKKPKAYIQWIAESSRHQSPVPIEVRVYSNLFKHEDPDNKEQVPGGWLSDINPDSLVVKKNALVEIGVRDTNITRVEKGFQFVRVGYFCVDPDSDIKNNKFVFNQTVSLKEDSKKDKK